MRYGLARRHPFLDLLVGDDAALLGVDEEHAARLQAALVQRRSRAAMSSTPTSEAMTTKPSLVTHVARRAQAVAVEHRADAPCRR